MSCGGIYPIADHFSRDYLNNLNPDHGCWQCHGIVNPDLDLFVNEYEAYLHRDCLGLFLCSPEGAIVIEHGHAIIVPELANISRRRDHHDSNDLPHSRPR